jgi:23S rRNA (adenine1618-N6)-methyltransferase
VPSRRRPALAPFVKPNAYGDVSIDYRDPAAVVALNRALFASAYGLTSWDVPPGHLCPPIPGRSDYIHHLADLIAGYDPSAIPRGPSVAVLDIGVGANCAYPLIGASEYGWRFVGTDIDPVACEWARKLAKANTAVADLIECRLQRSPTDCFNGVLVPGERFAASMCNPPFHASAEDAAASSRRKQRNLGGRAAARTSNFGGSAGELWCDGGELGFVQRMITQSRSVPDCCRWFTTLVSKSERLPRLYAALRHVQAAEVKTIDMGQGQKQSRILAWTFTRSA